MQNFFETVRSQIKTEDPILFEELLFNLSKLPIVPVELTNDLMAFCYDNEGARVSVLTKCSNFEKDDETIRLLLRWVDQIPFQHKVLVKNFLTNTPDFVLANYHDELLYYVGAEYLQYAGQFLPFEGKTGVELEPVWSYYINLLHKLGAEFDDNTYITAKQVQEVLILSGEYHESEVEKLLQRQLHNERIDENGILAIRAIGLMGLEFLHPVLMQFLARMDEELLIKEAVEACIRLQLDEIVTALSTVQPGDASFIQTVEILKGIKSNRSSETLAAMYPLATETGAKEYILDALTSHFSPLAIPFIDEFVAEGQYAMVFDMNEMFYGYYKMIDRPHPLLEQWHSESLKNAQMFEDSFKEVDLQAVVRENFGKVGRNDPCVCGSGKKFKKCCGKEA